ncbi:hypothetical protein BJ878DRAFT_488988 [Calycina marina]|uniref:Uncharacterized protein n=1 Tax=Calycina marina TaxID=1763456 RepID=A0A9P8CIW1_9HELO|nr:hypothetical protein BJ878DRAFT_488988 [Calycina marina]
MLAYQGTSSSCAQLLCIDYVPIRSIGISNGASPNMSSAHPLQSSDAPIQSIEHGGAPKMSTQTSMSPPPRPDRTASKEKPVKPRAQPKYKRTTIIDIPQIEGSAVILKTRAARKRKNTDAAAPASKRQNSASGIPTEQSRAVEESDGRSKHVFPNTDTTDMAAAKTRGLTARSPALRAPSTEIYSSRKPMANLFDELQITAEQFYHFQACAKDYMLDPEHMDRRNIIVRKNDGDVLAQSEIKRKLYDVTEEFLEKEGWGLKCWGKDAPNLVLGGRRIFWPDAKEDVIGICIPLMRRVVTNENQRLYAQKLRDDKLAKQAVSGEGVTVSTHYGGRRREVNIKEVHESLKKTLTKEGKLVVGAKQSPTISNGDAASSPATATASPLPPPVKVSKWADVQVHLNFIKNGHKAMPVIAYDMDQGEKFLDMVLFADIIIDDGKKRREIQILGPEGLKDVTNDKEWGEMLRLIRQADYMEGDVKVVIDVDRHK